MEHNNVPTPVCELYHFLILFEKMYFKLKNYEFQQFTFHGAYFDRDSRNFFQ